MKRILLALALIGLAFGQGTSSPRPRFETLLTEDTGGGFYTVVLHDKETGQETVCAMSLVYGGHSVSCWLTGRNWK